MGTNVEVILQDVATTFSQVSQPGVTSSTTSTTGPPVPTGFELGDPSTYFDITTTAVFSGAIEICIDYSGISYGDELLLQLHHYENDEWVDRTSSLDTDANIICASVNSLSPFAIFEPQFGFISGTVSLAGAGLENVIVSLHNENGFPVAGIDDVNTDANGEYSFNDVLVGGYQVMIVEPLGYIADDNPKEVTVNTDQTIIVDFNLTEVVVVNQARSKGYWKHQFDVYVLNRGNAQETADDLTEYIALVHQHYTLHYELYSEYTTYEDWQGVLSLKGNHPMVDRAKQHLAALIMNMVSGKIGQYTVVTDDGRDVGDVIQYCSEIILDEEDTNYELAKDLAESVNNQQTIAAGIVPEGDKLFKTGEESNNIEITTYGLFDSYPNPFNPATRIVYQIPEKGNVTLKVFDILGKEITTLVENYRDEGRYEVEFNASELASGVYIYQLRVNDFVSTKKMLLMK
ncbi:MAG: T9SS type A sorting domain-containing protein [Candidatus Hodarchaeales archaeon]